MFTLVCDIRERGQACDIREPDQAFWWCHSLTNWL